MNIRRNDNRQFNNLPTLPVIQCNADLHLNLNALNADWFVSSKGEFYIE
jgi:hypothetical protein